MKIIHIITQLELGGAQLNTLATCEHLLKQGHDVLLLSGADGNRDIQNRSNEWLRVISGLGNCMGSMAFVVGLYEIWYCLRSEKPDIVHTHSTAAGIVGRLAAWLARVPRIVHTVHGWGHHGLTGWRRWALIWIERQLARITDRFIFVSRADLKFAERLGIGVPIVPLTLDLGWDVDWGNKKVLIRSGIDRSRYRPLPLEQREKLVVTVGNMKPQKDYPTFRAFAVELKMLVSDVEIRHYGAGGVGWDGPVHLMGEGHDMAEVLPRARAFVLTSRWEGLPRSLLEALCSGTPTVCFDVGGISEVLNFWSGFAFDRANADVARLAHVTLQILSSDIMWREISKAAIRAVGSEFDIKTMLEQLDKLYLGLGRKVRGP